MWRLIFVLAAVAACGGSPTAAGSGDEVGTYTLVSIDGNALPATLTHGGVQATVVSATLILGTGGTVQMSTRFRLPPDTTTIPQNVSGSYQRSGSVLTFSYANGGANTGTVAGSDLRFLNEGASWLFHKS